jgi:hypothetical protein
MITDEILQRALEAANALPQGTNPVERLRAALEVSRPAIQRELLEFAWDGRARGSILGAIEQAEEAREAPPLGYGRHRPEE